MKNSDEFLSIGKVTGVFGVKGAVKFYSYAESVSIFKAGDPICLLHSDGWEKEFELEWVRFQKQVVVAALKGITDRDQAQSLVGARIFIKKETLPDLEQDTYYWFDLIGLIVYGADGTQIGRLDNIIETGSNDVYVVINDQTQKETLIPALESVVLNIDLNDRKMIVDLPEGL